MRRRPILDPHEYYSLLRPQVSSLDMWFIEYVQVLTGDNPVAEFTKGSFVGAWLSALLRRRSTRIRERLSPTDRVGIPARDDGVTLFPFRRFFLIAKR